VVVGGLAFYIIGKLLGSNRVSAEVEIAGLDVPEMGLAGYPEFMEHITPADVSPTQRRGRQEDGCRPGQRLEQIKKRTEQSVFLGWVPRGRTQPQFLYCVGAQAVLPLAVAIAGGLEPQ